MITQLSFDPARSAVLSMDYQTAIIFNFRLHVFFFKNPAIPF